MPAFQSRLRSKASIFGRTIAGLWKSVPKQGPLWPDECWSKDETGSWLLFGQPVHRHLLCDLQATLKVDPCISKIEFKLGTFMPSVDFPLDGSQKLFVPLLRVPGIGVWKCTHRSHSEICGHSQLPDGLATFRWKLSLEDDGKHCKYEIEHCEKNVVATHYFKRASSYPPDRKVPKHLAQSAFADALGLVKMPTLMEEGVKVSKSKDRCGCLAFAARCKGTRPKAVDRVLAVEVLHLL